MIYQVVASHRTGSTLLNDYALHYHDNFGFNELFLDKSSHVVMKKYSTEEKFEFLEYYKSKDIHFTFKIFPYRVINQGYEDRLFEFLKGYKILTIERDPWDAFVSSSYQDYCKWKTPHRHKFWKGIYESDFIKLKSFDINTAKIKDFCNKWETDFCFINKLHLHHTFKYSDLTTQHLQKYFNNKYVSDLQPASLNYESLATNYTEAKELFNNALCR